MFSADQIATVINANAGTDNFIDYNSVRDESGFHIGDIVRYPVTTAIDFMATLADSVTFGAFDIDTEDVTSWIDDNLHTNLTDFYEQNQEIVNLGSFAGGMLLPGMAALKFAKAAGSIEKGQLIPNFYKQLTNYNKINQAKAVSLLDKAGAASADYRQTMSAIKWGTIGEGVAEAAIFETGFALMMNQHPYIEGEYGADDFALGVALGSLAGPIKWMIESKKFDKLAQEATALATQKTAEVAPAKYVMDDRGSALGAMAQVYKTSFTYSSPVQSVQDALIKQREVVHQTAKTVVDSMLSDELKIKSKFNDVKKVVTPSGDSLVHQWTQTANYPHDMRFDVTPSQTLEKMVTKEPTIFVGVDSFSSFAINESKSKYAEASAKVMVHSMPGEVRAINPEALLDSLGIPSVDKVTKSLDTPSGVVTKSEHINGRLYNIIEIPNQKFLKGKDIKEWLSNYASGQVENNIPIVLRSKDGHFSGVKTKPFKETANEIETRAVLLQNADLGGNPAIGDQEALDHIHSTIKNDATFGVIIPHLGERIIPSDAALFMLPASGDAEVANKIAKNARVAHIHNLNYDLTKMRTQDADAGYLTILYGLRNSKPGSLAATDWSSDNLYHLQAVYLDALRVADRKVPTIYTIDGKAFPSDKIKNIEKLLITKKVEYAKQLKDMKNGFEQMAFKLNLDVEDTRKIAASSFVADDIINNSNVRSVMYSSTQNPDSILSTKPISVIGKHRTFGMVKEMQLDANLDKKFMNDYHSTAIQENIHSLPDVDEINNTAVKGTVQALYNDVIGNEAMLELERSINELTTNIKAINTKFTSTDQQLRHLGELADYVVTMNSNLTNATNILFGKIRDNVMPYAKAVASKPEAIIQFEQIRRFIQSNKNEILDIAPDVNKIILRNATAKNKGIPVYAEYLDGGEINMLPEVREFLEKIIKETRNLYDYMNFVRRNDNLPPLPDKGLWLPYEAVEDKFIAFKINKENARDTEIITASSEKEYNRILSDYKKDPEIMSKYDIVERDRVDRWNDLMDIAALNDLSASDPSKIKRGIIIHKARPDASGIDDILSQIERHYWHLNRTFIKQGRPELFSALDTASTIAESSIKSSKGLIGQRVGRAIPQSQIIKNALLNHSGLNSKTAPLFSRANDIMQAGINQGLRNLNLAIESLKSEGGFTADDFAKLDAKLKETNTPNPFASLDEFLAARKATKTQDMAQHTVAQINGFITTANLRLMDASHAILTYLSAPVVMSGLMKEYNYPMKEFIKTAKWMMKGDDEYKKVMEEAHRLGYVKQLVSEFSDLTKELHTKKNPLFSGKAKDVIDFLSKPSDFSEEFTREFAYALAYRMGKQNGIVDPALLRSHANAFVIRSMGNYNSRQRPTVFQGTLGGMLGLYQTFMVTMAQNVYRYIENADWRALSTLVGAQSGMFGIESLPFYNEFNRYLGAYVSADGTDVTAGIYDIAGGDENNRRSAAEFILFGAPSALFQSGFYTRGELQPRTPLYFDQGFKFTPPMIENMISAGKFGLDLVNGIKDSVKNNGLSGDMFHAAAQALSLQYIWRPGARLSEIAMGRSYDRKGEQLATNEFFSFPTITRLLSSRPLEEEVMKRLKFNGSYYNQIDRTRRQRVIRAIRRLASTGNIYRGDALSNLNSEYLDNGGSPAGWVDIMKRAYTESNTQMADRLAEEFKQNEGYARIFEKY